MIVRCIATLLIGALASVGYAQSTDGFPVTTTLVAHKVDFMFDGGSILFEFKGAEGPAGCLLLVHPCAHVGRRVKPQASVLWCRDSGFEKGNVHRVTKARLAQIISAMMRGGDQKPAIHRHATSVLLAIHFGARVRRWGPVAVEALEAGKWLDIFEDPEVKEAEVKEAETAEEHRAEEPGKALESDVF